MAYYLVFALQAYCIYRCYKKGDTYYWYFLIFFLPVIGCIAYLFVNVFRRKDLDRVQEGIIAVINPTKKITDLQGKFKFSATFENQVALADAYLEAKMYDSAIENYEASLKDVFKNDFYVISKLQEAYYFSSDFETSISLAQRIKGNTKFGKSRTSFLYALALEKKDNIDAAKEILETFDAPYSRYQERLELSKFYIRNGFVKQADGLLNEIVKESQGMGCPKEVAVKIA